MAFGFEVLCRSDSCFDLFFVSGLFNICGVVQLRLFSYKHVARNEHEFLSWHFSVDTLDKVWQLVESENALSLSGIIYFFPAH